MYSVKSFFDACFRGSPSIYQIETASAIFRPHALRPPEFVLHNRTGLLHPVFLVDTKIFEVGGTVKYTVESPGIPRQILERPRTVKLIKISVRPIFL